MLARADFALTPLHDAVVEPFTSWAVKQLVYTAEGGGPFSAVLAARAPHKPIKVSVLFDDGGRALWSRGLLEGGRQYRFHLAYLGCRGAPGLDAFLRLVDRLAGRFQLYGRFPVAVEPLAVRTVEPASLGAGLEGEYLRLDFHTPTLLQYPRHPAVPLEESVHTLYPNPLFLTANLVEKWNACRLGPRLRRRTAIYALYELREASHGIRPATARVGKVAVRGFLGWIVYRIKAAHSRDRRYRALLDFANYAGVGRSTTVGFGHVAVTPAGT